MMSVSDAIRARISTRAFLPTPVPETLVRDILDVARFAPSGGNTQAWRIIAVAGQARDDVIALAKATPAAERDEGAYPVYPHSLWEPYRTRRFKVGEDMYKLLGIAREDKPARYAQFARNIEFFGAPVGLFFVIEKAMGHSQWAHLGMLLQSVCLVAQERGLATCMQEAWAPFRTQLARHFELSDKEVVYCGMALGYADKSAPVNTLRSDRITVDELATFKGF
jgi:nitroreductase